ncbi:hypothetical protein SESBI_37323 [Sesbania bispinosa]|nr:hypothetical protein SESBI_37323 [Sesbania bispinosa]
MRAKPGREVDEEDVRWFTGKLRNGEQQLDKQHLEQFRELLNKLKRGIIGITSHFRGTLHVVASLAITTIIK